MLSTTSCTEKSELIKILLFFIFISSMMIGFDWINVIVSNKINIFLKMCFTPPKATYISPWLKESCHYSSKLTVPAFKFKSWTLWTVHTHNNKNGNCVLWVSDNVTLSLLMCMEVFTFLISTQSLYLAFFLFH